MTQQINLFNPAFRKQEFSFTSSTAIFYGVAIAIAIAAAIATYEGFQLRAAQAQASTVDQVFGDATANFNKLSADATKQKPNAGLEAEIAALEAQLREHQEIVNTLQGGAIGNTDGFSEYLRAFSRQSIAGLWLTAFDIARGGNEFALQGRTLSADLVANYLAQLNREKVIQGRQFAALRISQAPPETLKIGAEKKTDKDAKEQKPAMPPYLEFTISTMDISDAQRTEPKPVLASAPLLGPVDASPVLGTAKAGVKGAAQ
jgi:hypothetical protein